MIVIMLITIILATNAINATEIDNSTTINNGLASVVDKGTLTLREGIYNKTGDKNIITNKNFTITGTGDPNKTNKTPEIETNKTINIPEDKTINVPDYYANLTIESPTIQTSKALNTKVTGNDLSNIVILLLVIVVGLYLGRRYLL